MEDAGITAGLVAVAISLVELVEFMVAKLAAKNGNGAPSMLHKIDKIQGVVDRIFEMHDQLDEDGTPLWYVPRSWAPLQQQIASDLRDVAETQRRTAETLDRAVDMLERIERRMSTQNAQRAQG